MLAKKNLKDLFISMSNCIDTDTISLKYRSMAIDLENKKILMTNFHGTEQEKDFSEPSNCDGFGRIRHFTLLTSKGWPKNSLPIEPMCRSLGLSSTQILRAQVFQNAVCNWRCWYCYVPFDLLGANPKYSKWLSASDLINLYLNQPNPPSIIDLSGGQPDLVPEWVPWMMSELMKRGLENKVYLWSDDNLSNDYFWRYLNKEEIELIKNYKNYGKVCCFKGFDDESFSFNTKADPTIFFRQFDLMKRLLTLGIDLYAYATFTTPNKDSIPEKMHRFVSKLQQLDHYLPLRTIPLEIKMYNPLHSRSNDLTNESMKNQQVAIEAWQKELNSIYSTKDRSLPITNIPLGGIT